MKQINSFLLVFLSLCNFVMAQNLETIKEINDDLGPMAIKDNYLYLSVEDTTNLGISNNSRIVKIDITTNNPSIINVVTASDFINSLAFHGNDLYFTISGGAYGENSKIVKTDISLPTPRLIDVFTGINSPRSLVFKGDILFVLESERITKANVTDTTPVLTEFISLSSTTPNRLTNVTDMALHNDDLYISLNDGTGFKVVKTDVTATNPVVSDVLTGVNFINSLAFKGDDLYISFPIVDDKIAKINVVTTTLPTTIVTDVLTNRYSSFQLELAFKDDDLYIGEATNQIILGPPLQIIRSDKILKLDVDETLSITDFNTTEELKLFPNPANEFIKISDLKSNRTLDYTIYNSIGALVKRGKLSKDATINVESLYSGLYYLSIENNKTFKFVKS
ncbi:T9SS type A sorting domain-containing protein [Aquimarina sp. ERC-38]|uniref:T9SS type A sorting domain-containing protein n=1 Tax=Aquimarina sp. ERC-38 TaxID=2949996 RepID=UPI002245CB1C|nr:T9SS type A sorting domain-containing protein [Aquimarina sp. ERC-38]UZO79605.1 T9SS type A sorting domain-containing protein [Aquimarina sp. ERC-38]